MRPARGAFGFAAIPIGAIAAIVVSACGSSTSANVGANAGVASNSGCQGGGGGGGPTGGPADLFPCDSPWYTDVTASPVASDSASIIGSIGAFGAGGFKTDFSILYMHADASTPKHAFTVDYTDESDADPVPIPAVGALEGETGYTCTQGGDCHLLVIDDSQKKLFELYAVTDATSTFTAADETVWDLTKHYGPEGRGLGCTSSDVAGLSVTAGLIGVRETKAGAIKHALRFILPNAKIRTGPSYVPPASHGSTATKSDVGPAFGMRLRLHASFDESKITSPGGKAVVHALKTYGMFLADGGNYALSAEDERFEKAADPSLTWDGLLGGNDLTSIQPSDFDVVAYAPIETVTDCKRAP